MLDPHVSVTCVHVNDVHMETRSGVEAASYAFAKEGSAESPLVARWNGQVASAGANDATMCFYVGAVWFSWGPLDWVVGWYCRHKIPGWEWFGSTGCRQLVHTAKLVVGWCEPKFLGPGLNGRFLLLVFEVRIVIQWSGG